MSVQFLTNITEEEFKEFLKSALKEILSENQNGFTPQTPDILDVEQASEFLKLKVTTLYEKTSRKTIPHFKKGRKLYFHLSELKEWIKQGRVKTRDEIESQAITFNLNNQSKKAA